MKKSHYYPFGLQHKGYVGNHRVFELTPGGRLNLIPVRNYLDDSYRYTFGGKEEQPELGLNWVDHHARNYMPDLGRWMNVDPLGELAPSWTPYRYGFNNPMRFVDPTGLFETRAEARSYRKENNIKGKIQKGSDGNFAINDRKNNRSYYKDSSLDDIENVIGRGEDGVIESVFLTSSSSTSSSSGGFYVQDGTPIWGFGTEDNGHKNGTRRGSVDMRKMPFSGPTDPKSSSKFAEWIRYMLTGLGLVDNMPVINKTTGVTPKVSNKSEESNNIFYTEVHYSHKEKGIRWGSRRHINNLTSYEQGQKDSAGIMDGTTHFRLNSLLKIDSVGIRNTTKETLKMKRFIIIILLLMTSCVKKKSSHNQVSEYPKRDTISKIYYEDNRLKEIKLKDNKVKVFYRNGNLFKEGFVDKNDKLKGQWYYYTLEGKISEMREFNNFSGHVSLNRSVYYKGNLDSMIMEKDPYFNTYNQKEFIADTLPYNISMYTKLELGKDTISLREPWTAAAARYVQAFLNKDINIVVVLGDFDKDFSNIAEVKKDTFYNLLIDVDNQKWFPEENPAATVVFGKWFDSIGEKTIRGYLTEYYEVDSTINKESRVYFEKKLFVKDSIK